MCPGLQRDPAARHGTENFAQGSRIRTHPLLQLDLAAFIEHAIPAVTISQIESDGQCWLRNIPAPLCHYGANLLHCRSPFISCAFEHVDNLGAYTASRPETGLLPRKHSLGGAGLKYHCVAEAFQTLHEVSLQTIRVESIEVTAT